MPAISVWGQVAQEGFALPMVSLTPAIPTTQSYMLAWSTADQALAYVPVSVSATGDIDASGNCNLAAGRLYRIAGTQVVGARRTGWTAPTGTATRSTFDPATVTLSQVAERVKALIDDLTAHGLIGA